MAKWSMHGVDDYVAYLQRIGKSTDGVIGEAVYAMAGVVADKIRKRRQYRHIPAGIQPPVQSRKKGTARRTGDFAHAKRQRVQACKDRL